MAKLKTREELKNDGINLWNGRCMKLIDHAEDMGLRLMDKGKDTESLVGMDLAIDLLLAQQRIKQLEAAPRLLLGDAKTPRGDTVTDEETVRAAWDRVLVCGSYRSYLRGTILINWANNQFYDFLTWAAAAAFTWERQEQIEMARWCVSVLENHLAEMDGDSRKVAYVAILERERAELARLTVGMKEGK